MNLEKLNSFILADTEKCAGCRTCEIACALAHTENPPTVAGEISTRLTPRVFVVSLENASAPIMCRHCEDAPCANVCKMSAISREGGRVVVNAERCVGCRLCLMACPFGAIEFIEQQPDTQSVFRSAASVDERNHKVLYRANKCDLCFGHAEGPACVANCPEEALTQVSATKATKLRRREAAIDLQAGLKTTFALGQGE